MRQGASIEDIRLRQVPCGCGTVARVARMDDHDGQASRRQRGHHGPLGAPGRFAPNERRGDRLEARDEGGAPRVIMGDRPACSRGAEGNVPLGLGDIKTNKVLRGRPNHS